MNLPPFPVDDATLDLLMAAIDPRGHGDVDARTSSVGRFLEFMSQLGGSDVHAVEEVVDDGGDGGAQIVVMRDPRYHEHSVMAALVEEIRRLRSSAPREVAGAKVGQEQPSPVPNDHPPVVPQVVADLEQRMALGIRRYGVALQPFNGRNMLLDAYDEALDLAVYLKGALLERGNPPTDRAETPLTPTDNPWAPYSGYHEALFAEIRGGRRIDPDFRVDPVTGEVKKRPVRLTKEELDRARAELERGTG